MNILFVCTSNKDRSPALERHFREKYPMHKYRSAGINRHFTEKHGTHLLTREDVAWADLVVGSEDIHARKSKDLWEGLPASDRNDELQFVSLGLGDYTVEHMEEYVRQAERKVMAIRGVLTLRMSPSNMSEEGLNSFFMRDFAESVQNAAKLTPEQERVINEMKKALLELVSSPTTTTPHRCPVCNGKGVVPNGFYFSVSEQHKTSDAAPQLCRSCDGGGIVWEPSPTPPSSPVFGGPWECPKCGKTHRTSSIHCDREIHIPESIKK